jgi:cobalt/nickel transport system permease protein
MYAASIAAVAWSAKKIKRDELGESKAPLMAVSGAMVFAAQMVNFTIPGTGSSGHISGGILLAALLGPFAGMLARSAVLVIQCLVFADGGLLALGCNIFNIAVIPCLLIFPLITKRILSASPTSRRIWAGSVVSVLIALQLGAFAIVLQTTASGVVELPFTAFVLLMQPIHLVIGVVEGIVTAAILGFVHAARPQILVSNNAPPGKPKSIKKVIIVFACIAVALAAGASALASAYPDGLEWAVINVAGADGVGSNGNIWEAFAAAQERLSFMPGYDTGAGDGTGTPAAGLIGAALVFALAGAAALIIRAYKKRRRQNAQYAPQSPDSSSQAQAPGAE